MVDKKTAEKIKEGISVQEIENFGKRYRFEIFFLIYFILASFFTFLFFGAAWSICLAGVGAIVGVWLPKQIGKGAHACFRFVFKQEKITQLILAVVGIIISVFLPLIIFLIIGVLGGAAIYKIASDASGHMIHPEKPEEHEGHHHEEPPHHPEV